MSEQMHWLRCLWPEWFVEEEIGAGSFGRVYRICRRDIGGTYYAALKVISVPNSAEDLAAMERAGESQRTAWYRSYARDLSREFAVMERLKGNSHIVSYEDHKIVPRENGVGWDVLIRMELLQPIWSQLDPTVCPEQEAIQLGLDICSALDLCQRENIIHRDIKPGNLFRSHHGGFKLGDFGTALHAGLALSDRSARGTYPYMAPEVFFAKPYDRTIDYYSLGLILYRLMNYGRAPFLPPPPAVLSTGALEEAHRRRLSGEPLPRPLRASEAFSRVILRACAPDPGDRYPTALAFRRALEQCLYHEARPGPVPPEQQKPKTSMEQVFHAAGDL